MITRVKSTAAVQSLFTGAIQKGREREKYDCDRRMEEGESDKFVIESAENIDPLVSMEEDRSWDICICAQLTFTCILPLMHSMGFSQFYHSMLKKFHQVHRRELD